LLKSKDYTKLLWIAHYSDKWACQLSSGWSQQRG